MCSSDLAARTRMRYRRPKRSRGSDAGATSTSVATPALLPDGSIAPESLSAIIESAAAESFDEDRKAVAGSGASAEARALNPTREGESS